MTRIGSGYSRYSSASLASLLSSGQPSALKQNLIKSKLSIQDQPNQNEVVNKIEKHISDVKKGNGDASKDVAYLLGQQDSNASSILSQTNPKALSMYSGYLSGLRYDRAARFVNGVEHSVVLSSQLGQKQDEEV